MYTAKNKHAKGALCIVFYDYQKPDDTAGSRYFNGVIETVGKDFVKVKVTKSTWRWWNVGDVLTLEKYKVWAWQDEQLPEQLSLF